MHRIFLLILLLTQGLAAPAQLKDQDLEGVTIKSKKLTTRDILDSLNKNAPDNYAEPAVLAGNYTGAYYRGGDSIFAIHLPVYLFKEAEGNYSTLLRDSNRQEVLTDHRTTKAHFDRTLLIENEPFPAKSGTLKLVKGLYEIKETERILYAREGTEEDPYFYMLFRPKKKVAIPVIIRPFISSIDKDSLFIYSLLKIRRKNWAIVSHESAMLIAPPAQAEEMRTTASFARAKALIESVKQQQNLRRFIQQREWEEHPDGKYYFARALRSDNLLNISFALFKKFPDPQGYIGTSEVVYDYNKVVPPRESLVPYTIIDYTKERKAYSGKD